MAVNEKTKEKIIPLTKELFNKIKTVKPFPVNNKIKTIEKMGRDFYDELVNNGIKIGGCDRDDMGELVYRSASGGDVVYNGTYEKFYYWLNEELDCHCEIE